MAEKNGSRPKPDVDRLRADIKLTRAELGETVQALAAKADVKARAKAEVEQTKQRIRAQTAEATGRVREAAHAATDRVRHMTASFPTAPDGTPTSGSPAFAEAGAVRRPPIPLTAMLVAAAAVVGVVGVILVVRGRRR